MKNLQRLWNDIKRGENIDLYITVFAAIVLAILSIIGIASQTWIAPLTLVVLALLAYSMLGNRYQITEAYQQITQSADGLLQQHWPDENLREDIKRSKELLIISVSLARTARTLYSTFEEKLKHGDSIKILLVNPDSRACEITASRVYVDMDAERNRHGIQATLKTLSNLKQKTPGKLEIRLTDYPPSFGGFIIDPDTAEGVTYLKHYTYKMPEEDIPRVVFHPKDKYWYKFFTKQAQILWQDSAPAIIQNGG
jgi:hypothetical protein